MIMFGGLFGKKKKENLENNDQQQTQITEESVVESSQIEKKQSKNKSKKEKSKKKSQKEAAYRKTLGLVIHNGRYYSFLYRENNKGSSVPDIKNLLMTQLKKQFAADIKSILELEELPAKKYKIDSFETRDKLENIVGLEGDQNIFDECIFCKVSIYKDLMMIYKLEKTSSQLILQKPIIYKFQKYLNKYIVDCVLKYEKTEEK